MSGNGSARLAPLTGIVFVVLIAVGTGIGFGSAPDFASPPEEIAAYYDDHQGSVVGGGIIALIATPFLIWFAGCVRTAISRREPTPRHLGTIAFGGGVAAAALFATATMVNTMGGLRVDDQGEIGAETATALFDIASVVGFAATPAVLAALLLATGVAALRYGAIMPAWLAVITLVIGVADLIGPIGWIAQLVSLVWIIVVSVMLYVQRAVVGDARPG